MPNKTSTTQLLNIYIDFSKALDEGKKIAFISFDIVKAFDGVRHWGLPAKLQSLGLGDQLLRWVSYYLSHRKQRVVLNGSSPE